MIDYMSVFAMASSTEMNTEVAAAAAVHGEMQNFLDLMDLTLTFMKLEFSIMGFTFSYWQVLLLVALSGVIGYFIASLIS